MKHTVIHLSVATLFALAFAPLAGAQPNDAAQQRYNQAIAQCNNSNSPRPVRDACVRDAGISLDRARSGRATDTPDTIPDSRSTVIRPDGTQRSGNDSETTFTSPDGRAVIVAPPTEK